MTPIVIDFNRCFLPPADAAFFQAVGVLRTWKRISFDTRVQLDDELASTWYARVSEYRASRYASWQAAEVTCQARKMRLRRKSSKVAKGYQVRSSRPFETHGRSSNGRCRPWQVKESRFNPSERFRHLRCRSSSLSCSPNQNGTRFSTSVNPFASRRTQKEGRLTARRQVRRWLSRAKVKETGNDRGRPRDKRNEESRSYSAHLEDLMAAWSVVVEN